MADDALAQLLTTGATVATGGGVSAVVVRFLFGSVTRRLDNIERLLEAQVARDRDNLVELTKVRGIAEAAHRRLDELQPRRRR